MRARVSITISSGLKTFFVIASRNSATVFPEKSAVDAACAAPAPAWRARFCAACCAPRFWPPRFAAFLRVVLERDVVERLVLLEERLDAGLRLDDERLDDERLEVEAALRLDDERLDAGLRLEEELLDDERLELDAGLRLDDERLELDAGFFLDEERLELDAGFLLDDERLELDAGLRADDRLDDERLPEPDDDERLDPDEREPPDREPPDERPLPLLPPDCAISFPSFEVSRMRGVGSALARSHYFTL
jgi:hypothetical protein